MTRDDGRQNPRGERAQTYGPRALKITQRFFSDLVIGVPPSLAQVSSSERLSLPALGTWMPVATDPLVLRAATLLVTLPVFVQAPLVHAHPWLALLITGPLLALGIVLGLSEHRQRAQLGALLVGFAGSWLCGSLFWGWCRLHPLWHLPIEALALPLALGGLRSRWQLAGAFYLASLLGTAATDGAMALTGVMGLWPAVLAAEPNTAVALLQEAATRVLSPGNLAMVVVVAVGLIGLAQRLWQGSLPSRVAATTLITTLGVDGLFLALALNAPRWSGLI